MTTEEQIKSLEEKLSKISDEGIKSAIRNRIQKLKSELEKTEEKVETVSKEEEAKIKELESNIEKLEKAMTKTDDASLKSVIQKRLDKAKGDLADIKKEGKEDIKEAKQELKEAQQEIKQEVQEIKKKIERKAPIKKAKETKAEPKVEPKAEPKAKEPVAVKKYQKKEKERVVKSKKRVSKMKTIISDLEKLIDKSKVLKAAYTTPSGQLKVKDIDRDAARPAKPFGYRFKGKHDYRVPTLKQIKEGKKTGKIDYEGRPDRSDKYPKRKVMLKDGGMIKYGVVEESTNRILIKDTDKSFIDKKYKELKEVYDEKYPNEKISIVEFADGGMMAKGGMTKKKRYVKSEGHPNFKTVEEAQSYASKLSDEELRNKVLSYNGEEYFLADEMDVKMAKGGIAKDAQKFAKPSGWRWKDSAVEDGIIRKASLSKSPSAKMRKEYPDYVYFENRKNKSDKNPSRRYKSI